MQAVLGERAFLPYAVARDVVTNIDVGSQSRQTGVPRCRAGGKKRARFWVQPTKVLETPGNIRGQNDDIALNVPTSGTGRGFREHSRSAQRNSTCSPDIDSATATILVSSLYSEIKSYAQ